MNVHQGGTYSLFYRWDGGHRGHRLSPSPKPDLVQELLVGKLRPPTSSPDSEVLSFRRKTEAGTRWAEGGTGGGRGQQVEDLKRPEVAGKEVAVPGGGGCQEQLGPSPSS